MRRQRSQNVGHIGPVGAKCSNASRAAGFFLEMGKNPHCYRVLFCSGSNKRLCIFGPKGAIQIRYYYYYYYYYKSKGSVRFEFFTTIISTVFFRRIKMNNVWRQGFAWTRKEAYIDPSSFPISSLYPPLPLP